MSLLEIKGVSKFFGGVAAVADLDMKVAEGEIHALIGPNGAGKTTIFNVITGFFRPERGQIIFKGHDITGIEPHNIAKRGLIRTFQQIALFRGSTVLNNVLAGFHLSYRMEVWREFLRTPAVRKLEQRTRQEATDILEFMGLGPLKNELAANLPHGHQRTLGICVALACNPSLLLLDEPAAGMNPTETENLIDKIGELRRRKKTIVIVEHDMKAVMKLSDRITVLNFGRKIAEGPPREIQRKSEVIEAYLGREGD